LDLKLLLKRGALLAAANWPLIAIQFVAETTFHVLLAVPVIGAAILVAVLLGADVANLLQGTLREMFAAIADALMAEPVALAAFILAFGIVLMGGSVLMFLVKGGTVDVLLAANEVAGPIEHEAITFESLQSASAFSLTGYMAGCGRLFRPYLSLGILLMLTYGLSGAVYLAFVVFGYRMSDSPALLAGWAFLLTLATLALVVWITLLNLVYLLLQVVIAAEGLSLTEGFRVISRFARAELRQLGGVFLLVFAMVVGATLASALAWSGVGLVAFVPLVGLAVFPLQIVAFLFRGFLYQFIGLTALGAYVSLYQRHRALRPAVLGGSNVTSSPVSHPA
jgi:hypothetical protein